MDYKHNFIYQLLLTNYSKKYEKEKKDDLYDICINVVNYNYQNFNEKKRISCLFI